MICFLRDSIFIMKWVNSQQDGNKVKYAQKLNLNEVGYRICIYFSHVGYMRLGVLVVML